MKTIKTYEDACQALNQEPADFTKIPEKFHALEKLETVIRALNEGWTPDYSNASQRKYEIWWYFENGCFVFNYYSVWYRNASVSSRLCFKSSDLAEYCAKQFEDLWNEYLCA